MTLIGRIVFGATVWLTLSLAMPAAAQNLVRNPSFEEPPLSNGDVVEDFIFEWAGTPSFGTFRNNLLLAAPDGANIAYVNRAAGEERAIAQTISSLVLDEPYVARAQFGWRNDNAQSDVALQLWVGGAVSGGDVIGGALVASSTPTTVQGSWVVGQLNYVPLPAHVGQPLHIRLVASGPTGAQGDFDDVSLTYARAVPTLSEWAMILLGLMLAGGAAWTVQTRRSLA